MFEGGVEQLPSGFQEIKCHMIFNVKKWRNLPQESPAGGGGHTTEAPATLTYLLVVARDSVRIALTVVALNELEVMACDIQNAYLTANCCEKILDLSRP